MRVLILEFITTIGGVQSVYKNVLPYLSKKHEIFFLDPYQDKFDEEIKNIPHVNYVDIKINSPNALGWKNNRAKLNIFLKYGLIYMKYIFKVKAFINEQNIDLIYVSGKKGVAFAYIIKLITGTNYIYHSHGFNTHKDIGRFYLTGMEKAVKIIAVSHDVKNKLIKAGNKKKKLLVVYNGVDMNYIHKRAKLLDNLKFNNNEFNIISISSLHEGKGIHILIETINKMLSCGLSCHLRIIGDITNKHEEEYIKNLISLSKKVDSSKIEFLGFQKNVFPYIRESDILVLPSTQGFESFGMVLVEAMCLNKAVIGSRIGGVPEVIKDGHCGYLTIPGDINDLYKKLILLYNDRVKLESMGNQGYNLVMNNFSAELQANNIARIIDNISLKDGRRLRV